MTGAPVDLNGADALLMVGDSERNADLFWATGFRAPDPFIYLASADAAWVVVKDLELDRAREEVRGAEVLAGSRYEARGDEPAAGGQLGEILRSLQLRRLLPSPSLPCFRSGRSSPRRRWPPSPRRRKGRNGPWRRPWP